MEKLTETWKENKQEFVCFTECKEDCKNNHISDCQCKVIQKVMQRLNEFESIGLMPDEIKKRL